MSEQNPFSAPLSVPPVAPVPLAPASPFAPPPPPAPPAPVSLPVPPAPVPPPPTRADHPSMTLTELSFSPVAAEAPPAPEPVAPPSPGLVNDVLPSGGVAAGRSVSLSSGRLPLIGLVVIALLAAVGVVFGTGLLKGDKAAPAPVAKKPTIAAPLKPAALPKGFKAVTVTKQSGTPGRAYALAAPATWKSESIKSVPGPARTELVLGDKVEGIIVQTTPAPAGAGAALDAVAKAGRAGGLKSSKGKAVGAIRRTKVDGHDARSFDIVADGSRIRTVMFVDGTTAYLVIGATKTKAFTKFVPTYEKVLRTWNFAGK